jgi:glucoamylase
VADRYLPGRGRKDLEIWKFSRQVRSVPAGATLRIQSAAPFRLHFSLDGWRAPKDSNSAVTALGIHYADIVVPRAQQIAVEFTFFWPEADRWEGRDFRVEIGEPRR